MARRISVEIVGNAASLERSFGRASASAVGFHRDLNKATRGALSGSGIMRSFGRSLAFASGGFLAFATIGGAIRSSIDAATDAAATQRQLAAQLKASGLSYKSYRGEIDQTNLHLSALSGFTKDELDKSFTTIVRGTGNVNKALADTALAADIARGRHISLSTASIAVGKAAAGSTTALRRLGIILPKGTTGTEALAIASRKFAGQAAAGATAQQKFAAVLHDSEVIIGSAILPTLNRYLAEGARWLDQMNRSGRLQRDVAVAAQKVGTVLRGVSAVFHGAASAMRVLDRVTGSTANTLKAFAAVWVALRVRTSLVQWGIIEAGIFRTGGAAALATGEVAGLRGALLGLRGIGPLAIPIILLMSTKRGRQIAAENSGNTQGLLSDLMHGDITKGSDWEKLGKDFGKFAFGGVDPNSPVGRLFGMKPKTQHEFTGPKPFPYSPSFDPSKIPHAAAAASGRGRTRRPLSLQGRFNLADYALAQAGMTQSQADDRRALETEAAITREQLAQAKTLKDKTKYAQQLAGIMQQIQGIDASTASAAEEKRKAAAEKQRAAKERASQFSVPLRLQLAQAKADAIAAGTGSTDMTGGQISAAKAIRAAALKAIHSHRLSIQGLIDAWNEVLTVNQQLASQTGSKGLKASYHHASTKAIVAGLGLTRDQAVAVRERAAQAEAHRGQVPSGPAAQGQPIHIGTVHVHGVQDVNKLWSELEKVGKRRHQRRGTR